MVVYVHNPQLERIGVIDTQSSIIWTNRYYSPGDFELYLSATTDNLELLKMGNIVVRDGYEDNAMVIEKIIIDTDAENGNYITVSGRCLKSLLYRRIIWQQTSLTGYLESCISRILEENAVAPEDSDRAIPGLKNGNTLESGASISTQATGDNLGETIEAMCQNAGIGWDIQLDLDRKGYTFILYRGVDRSYDQHEVPYVVFSNEFENLLKTTYTFDKTKFGNVAEVAGEGEGTDRKVVTLGDAKGLDRYEVYVDARDVSSNNGETPIADYNEQLIQRGQEKLAEADYTENFEGEVSYGYTYEFGKDYFLGDIVEVVNEYGMAASTRILEIIQSEDESGIYTIPTFSNYISKN